MLIITGAHELSAEKLKDEIGRVGILIVFFTLSIHPYAILIFNHILDYQ